MMSIVVLTGTFVNKDSTSMDEMMPFDDLDLSISKNSVDDEMQ